MLFKNLKKSIKKIIAIIITTTIIIIIIIIIPLTMLSNWNRIVVKVFSLSSYFHFSMCLFL